MKVKHVAFGIATYIPGLNRLFRRGTGGTNTARYCYSVWLRHLLRAHHNGLSPDPKTVAELGPGDSIGIGLAALLSGADMYYALDIVKHANVPRNLEIFDELVALFRTREDIPASDEFPNVKPGLESYKFPDDVLTSKRLLIALGRDRIGLIRRSIVENNRSDSVIKYVVPWFDSNIIEKESVDMIYSQAVLEHVDGLRHTYEALYSWLKPNGFMSHQIDFKSHGTASKWNGHWTYSDLVWRLIRGNRRYLLNREPYSTHIKLLKDTGFRKIWEQEMLRQSEIDRRDLAKRFRNVSQEDLNISGAFIQAVK
jgi:predicted SAM-dependent methyltransferase